MSGAHRPASSRAVNREDAVDERCICWQPLRTHPGI